MYWYSVSTEPQQTRLRSAWIDAPIDNLETCGMILAVALDQVWAYAPESEDDEGEPVTAPTSAVPDRLVYAQLQQAINLWAAGSVSTTGDSGPEGFSYTPRPLDKTIRTIIRPIRGMFSVG